jgi:hypothetical protein
MWNNLYLASVKSYVCIRPIRATVKYRTRQTPSTKSGRNTLSNFWEENSRRTETLGMQILHYTFIQRTHRRWSKELLPTRQQTRRKRVCNQINVLVLRPDRCFIDDTVLQTVHDHDTGALLGYYAASCGNCLPTFRDNVSVLPSRAVAQLVEALRYKPEGHGFESRWCHWNFHWHNPSGRTMALGSTQPLTEMCTRNLSWGVKAAGAYGWQPATYMCRVSWNLGASTSWNPKGLSRPVMGMLYLYLSYLQGSRVRDGKLMIVVR